MHREFEDIKLHCALYNVYVDIQFLQYFVNILALYTFRSSLGFEASVMLYEQRFRHLFPPVITPLTRQCGSAGTPTIR